MKNKYSFKKVFEHLPEEEQAEIKSIVEAEGKDIDELMVERKAYASEVKEDDVNEEERWAIKYVSTRDVDSSGDVVIPKGVILTEFKRTGMPFFWGHDISQPPLGSDEWVKTDDIGVKVKSHYADTGEGTLADIVWRLVKQGHQKQSSVGLVVLDSVVKGSKEFSVIDKELARRWPEYNKNRKSVNRILTKTIMFEHSDVGIGMNNNTDVLAVSKMWKDEGADEEILKRAGLLVEDEEIIEANFDNVECDESTNTITLTGDMGEIKDVEELDENDESVSKDREVEDTIEVSEEVLEEKKFANVLKKPTFVKVLSVPEPDIQEQIDREIRKALGKVV